MSRVISAALRRRETVAAFFGLGGEIVEGFVFDAGYRGLGGEVDLGDGGGWSSVVSRVTTAVVSIRWLGELGAGELGAEGHGDRSRRGLACDELFGVGAGALFKAGLEAVLGVVEGSGFEGGEGEPLPESCWVACQHGGCVAVHGESPYGVRCD